MASVARVGDPISHGGQLSSGASHVKANGVAVVRIGDHANCSEHGDVTVSEGSSRVLAEGVGVARSGDQLSCGAVIQSGSSNVSAS